MFEKAKNEDALNGEVVLNGVRRLLSARELLFWPVGICVIVVFGVFINLSVISVLQGLTSNVAISIIIVCLWIIWLLLAKAELVRTIQMILLLFAKRRIRVAPDALVDEMIICNRVCWCRVFDISEIGNVRVIPLNEHLLQKGIRDDTERAKQNVVVFEYNGEGEQSIGESLLDTDMALLARHLAENIQR